MLSRTRLRKAQSTANSLFGRLGIEIVFSRRIGANLLRDVVRLCPTPNVIFDIGANVGQKYREFREMFPAAEIFSFEPSEASLPELRNAMQGDPRGHVVELAAGDRDAESQFFEYEHSSANSMLRAADSENAPDWTRRPTSRTVRQTTVDVFCSQKHLTRVDLLKTDTQGFDGAVIRGAQATLKNTKIVIVEAIFEPQYQDQSGFDEVYRLLYSAGFRLIGLYDQVRAADGMSLSYGDALFASRAALR